MNDRASIDYFSTLMIAVGGYRGAVMAAVTKHAWMEHQNHEPRPCRLNLSALATKTGLHRQGLTEAAAQLIQEGLLTRLKDGSLLPNKNYATGWPGSLLARRPTLVRYCRAKVKRLDDQGATP